MSILKPFSILFKKLNSFARQFSPLTFVSDVAHIPLYAGDFTGALHVKLNFLLDVTSTHWQLAFNA